MNINNFESYINKTIFDRGYNYYMEGHIVEFYQQGENEYFFHIEGSNDYEVVVGIGDNGDIIDSSCDCPYDFGPVCKHEVAAYFQLQKMFHHETIKTDRRKTIHEVLNNQSKEELINIIINFTSQDPALENSLIVKYSTGDKQQELEACQELIDSVVRKYTGREGFIKYRDTGAFVTELEDVVDKARNTEDPLVALDIALLLLMEAMGAFQYADDSSGEIGALVSKALTLIAEIATSQTKMGNERFEIITKILDQTDNEVFDGWTDFKIDLLNICIAFSEDETIRERVKTKIESMLDQNSIELFTRYNNERLLELLFLIIEQYGTQEEADQFIQDHLKYASFREKLLMKYLQEENYLKVIEIAIDGEKQDQRYPGLLSKWKKLRYSAYKSLSLKEEQQILAKELLFDGNFDYYHILKEMAENQVEFYTNLKHELKTSERRDMNRIFLKLVEEEHDLEEILDFVRANPAYIEVYDKKLVKHFKEEIIEIYQKYIHSVARQSSNRKDYQGVCQKITRYKKLSGKPKQQELISELMGLYKKRPAFIDELGKLF
ncbi:SWIM zinc finger family protein [Bacillus coreaensis]